MGAKLLRGVPASALAAVLIPAAAAGAPAPHSALYGGTPQDFVEINQLFAQYDFTIDNGDGVGWSKVFTADGVFQDPSWCAIGRDQLVKVVGTTPQMGKDQQHHHVPTIGPIHYADRNHATVHSTVMVVAEKGAGHTDGGITVTGTYDDTLVRQNGRWLFAYRLVHRPSGTPPVPCAREAPYVAKIGD